MNVWTTTFGTCTAALALVIASTAAHSAVIAEDGMAANTDYTNNNTVVGVNGGTGFQGGWTDGGGTATTTLTSSTGGLTYLNLYQTAGALKHTPGGFAKVRRQIANGNISGDTVYFSVLYQRGVINNTLDYLSFGEALGQERFRIQNDGSGQIQVAYNGVVQATTTTLNLNNTLLIVGSYRVGLNPDALNLYFNPTDLTDVVGTASETLNITEASLPAPTFFFGFEYIQLSTNADETVWDEFRFAYDGASISDVTPIPEPASVLLLGMGGALLLARRRVGQ